MSGGIFNSIFFVIPRIFLKFEVTVLDRKSNGHDINFMFLFTWKFFKYFETYLNIIFLLENTQVAKNELKLQSRL